MRKALLFLIELPAAVFSFVFFLAARALMRRAVSAHFARHPDAARSWRVVCREQIEKRLTLFAAMTAVPRWNTHAVCATAGPVEAASSIAVRCESPRRSSENWAIVVNE